jgi:competence ComEA-like helix-hairpin-helix protein
LGVKPSPSQPAAGLIVAALALVALASGRAPSTAAPLRRAAAKQVSALAVRALRDGESLDLNRASPADLVLLPGVGPKLASRIVDERVRRGGFRHIEDLREVKGIGAATLDHLRRFVRVARDPTDRATVTH